MSFIREYQAVWTFVIYFLSGMIFLSVCSKITYI